VPEALRILMVEDSEDDVALILRQLCRGGFEPSYERVETAQDMTSRLAQQEWDLVLSDYNMPRFSGHDALQVLIDSGRDIPFIIISGAIGEETAVELMKAGAHDYIMKDNLARLAPAVERELREAKNRRAKRHTEETLLLSARVFENSAEGIIITDANAKIMRVNQSFIEVTGYSEMEVLGKRPNILQSGRHDEDFYRHLWASVKEQGHWQGEVWNRRKSGEVYPEWLTISAVQNEAGDDTHYIGSFTDLSQQKEAEERIQHLMYYDALTDLPNRTLFRDRFKQSMERAKREKRHIAFVHVDLDRFGNINDSLGHRMGDHLLCQVGPRIQQAVRNQDIVARLGGDEFSIALTGLAHLDDMQPLLNALSNTFSDPFDVGGKEIFVTSSFGVAIFPDDTEAYDDLVRFADTAVHHLKRQGGSGVQFYNRSMSVDGDERISLESALRHALKREEFRLYYQPQVAMDGKIIGVEALLRWQHGDEGMVFPSKFIPLLEETGLIISVGEWVLRQACRDQRAWKEAGHAPIPIAVNLSPRQFRNKDLISMVCHVLEEMDADPSLIELEITESSVMDNPDEAMVILRELHDMGISIAIDDFGTGYSSLSYLKRFPLDVLKIDRSFVADVPGDADDEVIIDTIIAMAHRLKLNVTAEGVEEAAQVDFLREHGCDQMQGYYFARPMPAAELQADLPLQN
jgi:diguanylate cyclase (GGDEF)-like protein/PAS domain S-box-containing protein